MNPIHGKDLVRFCVQSFSEMNRTLDVGGPEILTYEQMARIAFDILDQQERITHIPAVLLTPVSGGIKMFSRHHYGLFRFFVNVMTHYIMAPKYGKHKLGDFFKELR